MRWIPAPVVRGLHGARYRDTAAEGRMRELIEDTGAELAALLEEEMENHLVEGEEGAAIE